MLAMKNVRFFAFLFPLTFLLGCTVTATPTPIGQLSLTGNWQIQAGTAITSPPATPYLVGDLQGTNSALSGTFTTGVGTASPTVGSYSGSYNTSTGILSLQNPPSPGLPGTVATLSVPANPAGLATGTLSFICEVCAGLTVTFPVVAAEIAPVTGTYSGILSGTLTTASPITSTPISGTASVTFTQSTTPNSAGQFPLTGTVTFPSSSGIGTTTLPGLISGITIELSTEPCIIPFSNVTCNVVGPGFVLFAYTNPAATQITVTSLNGSDEAGTGVTLTGTLTLQ